MTRNNLNIVRLGVGAAIVLAVAYVLFPAFQTRIAATAPLLLLLLCPLMMVFCMRGMHKDAPPTDDTLKVKQSKRDPNDMP